MKVDFFKKWWWKLLGIAFLVPFIIFSIKLIFFHSFQASDNPNIYFTDYHGAARYLEIYNCLKKSEHADVFKYEFYANSKKFNNYQSKDDFWNEWIYETGIQAHKDNYDKCLQMFGYKNANITFTSILYDFWTFMFLDFIDFFNTPPTFYTNNEGRHLVKIKEQDQSLLGYYKYRSYVYWHGIDDVTAKYLLVKGANSRDFKVIDVGLLGKDKNNVYYMEKRIANSDSDTFQILSRFYSKDKNQVYYHMKPIFAADPVSFTTVERKNDHDAEDKKYKYKNGKQI